jgi:hypothetical protein
MTKNTKYTNSGMGVYKSKKKSGYNSIYEEEEPSLKDIRRDRQQKQYRNYENALRSKNLDRLLSYDDE